MTFTIPNIIKQKVISDTYIYMDCNVFHEECTDDQFLKKVDYGISSVFRVSFSFLNMVLEMKKNLNIWLIRSSHVREWNF